MKKEDILPLGSVVQVEGETKKLMIVQRAMMAPLEDGEYYFDYGGCFYPEGILGDQIFYFNHEYIANVVEKGVVTEEEELAKNSIFKAYQNNKSRRKKIDGNRKGW